MFLVRRDLGRRIRESGGKTNEIGVKTGVRGMSSAGLGECLWVSWVPRRAFSVVDSVMEARCGAWTVIWWVMAKRARSGHERRRGTSRTTRERPWTLA